MFGSLPSWQILSCQVCVLHGAVTVEAESSMIRRSQEGLVCVLGAASVQRYHGPKDWCLFLTERFLKVERLSLLVWRYSGLVKDIRALRHSQGSTWRKISSQEGEEPGGLPKEPKETIYHLKRAWGVGSPQQTSLPLSEGTLHHGGGQGKPAHYALENPTVQSL